MVSRRVAVDLGASGGRIALGTLTDGAFDVEIVHRFENGPIERAGGLYWDVSRLWEEIRRGLRKAGERGRIDSVGVNSWGVDYALIGESGDLIDGIRHYRDPRTEGMIERVLARIPRERLYGATGIQIMALNTIFQLAAHVRDDPVGLERARRLLLTPDLFHFWLSGAEVAEATIASTTQLFDPISRDWHDELIGEMGFPRELFPPIVSPGTPLGRLREEFRAWPGLAETQVIAPAGHDTACAVAATPAQGEDWAYLSCGTWALVGIETPRPMIDESALGENLTNEAGLHGSNRLLKNIVGLWILQECRRAWGNPPFDELYGEAAAASDPGARIDPDDPRFIAPGEDMPARVLDACGVELTRGALVRVVLQSLADRVAEVLDRLEGVSGRVIRRIHLVGGGAQIPLLARLIAESAEREVIAGPVEATLLGNLLIQAEATEAIGRGMIREVVRETQPMVAYPATSSSR